MDGITFQQTKDYAMFEMHEMNRVVVNGVGFKPRKDLLDSMKREGFRASQPIRCAKQPNGKLKIFDGHNRFVTARHLGIPLWYLAIPEDQAITPLEDNEACKPWNMMQRTRAHSHSKADYAEVVGYHESTGIPIGAAFGMFYGNIASDSNCRDSINKGTYKIKNRDLPWKVAAVTRALSRHCKFATNAGLVLAVSKAVFAEGFDVDRMAERIDRRPDLIRKCRGVDEWIDMLEAIYNHGTRGERLYLKVEIDKAMRARNAVAKHSEK